MAIRGPYRRYSAKEKARAVGLAMVEGVTATEESIGIPKNTIQGWLNKPEFVELRTTARKDVLEGFWVGIQVGVQQLTQGLTGPGPLRDKAETVRVLVEKFALLNGEATARDEHRDLTGNLDDHERATLRAALEVITGDADPAPR